MPQAWLECTMPPPPHPLECPGIVPRFGLFNNVKRRVKELILSRRMWNSSPSELFLRPKHTMLSHDMASAAWDETMTMQVATIQKPGGNDRECRTSTARGKTKMLCNVMIPVGMFGKTKCGSTISQPAAS